ncbi:MAG: hypothetical protein ABIQ61_03505 [Ornithinibacter sp.]
MLDAVKAQTPRTRLVNIACSFNGIPNVVASNATGQCAAVV